MLLYRASACCYESGVARSTNWVMGDMLLMTITMDRMIVELFKMVVRNMKHDIVRARYIIDYYLGIWIVKIAHICQTIVFI